MKSNRYNSDWISQYSEKEFESKYTYSGNDLGCIIKADSIEFRIWSPFAKAMTLCIYDSGDVKDFENKKEYEMTLKENGVWYYAADLDLINKYYTYRIDIDGSLNEFCDPYAKACGVNGKRAMILRLEETNPEGWDDDKNPNENLPFTESVIYEMHTRDFSINPSSGIKNKGKFIGVVENNTFVDLNDVTLDNVDKMTDIKLNRSAEAGKIKTGVDHLKELGITHVHFLPFYDYATIDESLDYHKEKYNWGYDPLNYNIPEGSYSTDAFDGSCRVRELKETVKGLHKNGISVIMDVVYNHTYNEEFCFNIAVPGYFHRIDKDGKLSNGSQCGNDTASERSMVSKYIVDSVLYWAKEYHLDGFRFDLVGLLDVDTINKIREGLDKIKPNMLLYGEGWELNTELTKDDIKLATQKNVKLLNGFAMFSDDIRDAMKGSVFEEEEKGFISGNTATDRMNNTEVLKKSIMGLPDWSQSPLQVINYTSCHDNYTLFDKIRMCNENISFEDAVKQNNLAISIVMLSQGIPLMHAGEEMLRAKVNKNNEYVSDSVNSSDDVNSIRWYTLCDERYAKVYEFYKGIISFRKAHKLFMLEDVNLIKKDISFFDTKNDNVIAYELKDDNEEIIVLFSSNEENYKFNLPAGEYEVFVKDDKAGTDVITTCKESIVIKPFTAIAMVKRK